MLRRALPLALAGILLACGGTSTPDGAATEATTVPVDTAAPGSAPLADDVATAAPAALQLTAPLVGGGEIELDAFAGRPVLLWFWAPW